jgi:hypothetical protein
MNVEGVADMKSLISRMSGFVCAGLLAGCMGGRYYISQYEAENGPVPEGLAAPSPNPVPEIFPTPLPAAPDEPCTVAVEVSKGSSSRHVERVLVSPARTETRLIPAVIEWQEEQVLIRPEREVLKVIPADFEWIDDAMAPEGRRKVVVRPAQTERVIEPAEYRTVRNKVIKVPERREEVEVPAVYKEVMVDGKSEGPQVENIPVVCPEDIHPALIQAIQKALIQAGYSPGPADGQLGTRTARELKRFQLDHHLAPVGLSYPTLEALGIKS